MGLSTGPFQGVTLWGGVSPPRRSVNILYRPIPVLAVLVVRIERILIKGRQVTIHSVEHPLANVGPVVEEDPGLCVQRVPFTIDLDYIEGVTVPSVVGAESVGTLQADALTYIEGFERVIHAGAPSVLLHPPEHHDCLAVVSAVVLEFLSDLYIIGRWSIGFLKILDHRRKAGNVRHLDIGDAVLDYCRGCF